MSHMARASSSKWTAPPGSLIIPTTTLAMSLLGCSTTAMHRAVSIYMPGCRPQPPPTPPPHKTLALLLPALLEANSGRFAGRGSGNGHGQQRDQQPLYLPAPPSAGPSSPNKLSPRDVPSRTPPARLQKYTKWGTCQSQPTLTSQSSARLESHEPRSPTPP